MQAKQCCSFKCKISVGGILLLKTYNFSGWDDLGSYFLNANFGVEQCRSVKSFTSETIYNNGGYEIYWKYVPEILQVANKKVPVKNTQSSSYKICNQKYNDLQIQHFFQNIHGVKFCSRNRVAGSCAMASDIISGACTSPPLMFLATDSDIWQKWVIWSLWLWRWKYKIQIQLDTEYRI